MKTEFHLSDFMPYRLAVISERVSNRLSVDYNASHGLTAAEWRVLVHLQHCGVVSVRDLQVFTNLEKSRVSRAVERLRRANLVAKQVNEADARLLDIALTDAGREALKCLLDDACATEEMLLRGVSQDDLAAFFRVIDTLHAKLDDDPTARPKPEPEVHHL